MGYEGVVTQARVILANSDRAHALTTSMLRKYRGNEPRVQLVALQAAVDQLGLPSVNSAARSP